MPKNNDSGKNSSNEASAEVCLESHYWIAAVIGEALSYLDTVILSCRTEIESSIVAVLVDNVGNAERWCKSEASRQTPAEKSSFV